jgi:hypothetical protein
MSDKPGLALIIAEHRKGKSMPDAMDKDEKEPKDGDEEKMEHSALSQFAEALTQGDMDQASDALKGFLSICYPQLQSDEEDDEDKEEM